MSIGSERQQRVRNLFLFLFLDQCILSAVRTQKNRLIESVRLSTQRICLN